MARLRLSKDVQALNPHIDVETRRTLAGVDDVADQLIAQLSIHATDLPKCVKNWPFSPKTPEMLGKFGQKTAPTGVKQGTAGTFFVDLAWPVQKLCIEVNGGYHAPRGGKHGTDRDHYKIRQLVLAGQRVLVFTANEVRTNPLGCIEEIRQALQLA